MEKTWLIGLLFGMIACAHDDDNAEPAQPTTAALEAAEIDPVADEPITSSPAVLHGRYREKAAPVLSSTSVRAFVTWASGSRDTERDVARSELVKQRTTSERAALVAGFKDEFMASKGDVVRQLVVLGLLGEARLAAASSFLCDITRQPLSANADYDIAENSRIMVAVKAAYGLGYLREKASDRCLLTILKETPSRAHRAGIVRTLMWNSPQLRGEVDSLLSDGDKILLDAFERRGVGFDGRQADFLKKHPEAQAPPWSLDGGAPPAAPAVIPPPGSSPIAGKPMTGIPRRRK